MPTGFRVGRRFWRVKEKVGGFRYVSNQSSCQLPVENPRSSSRRDRQPKTMPRPTFGRTGHPLLRRDVLRAEHLAGPPAPQLHRIILLSPLIPRFDPLLEDCEMFRVRHCRVTSLASAMLRMMFFRGPKPRRPGWLGVVRRPYSTRPSPPNQPSSTQYGSVASTFPSGAWHTSASISQCGKSQVNLSTLACERHVAAL
jgi:hypothetical protein